jgi:NTP pyrophosphatase (non-canonical NTP hydrolase)
MNKTFDYIKILTKHDSKTLSQKTLKTSEELGELSKAVLPFENAAGTTHRFIDKQHILEEVVDTMLCLYSIAYDLDFTDEEILAMMDRKSMKWAGLLAREKRIKYPIPYEIHVTIEQADLELFKTACAEIGVKPILLDLHLSNNGVMKDLMTSSVFKGNNKEAYEEVKRISNSLTQKGFKVVREKIETIPWHPAAPSIENNVKMPENCYFESHLNVICNDANKARLNEIANIYSAKMSRNVFKKLDNDSYTIMVTYRAYDGAFETFRETLDGLIKELTTNGFLIEKEIVEFSIYDTKVSHDSAWINK